MRIPNMSTIQPKEFSDELYELRRIKDYCEPDRLGYDLSDEKSKRVFVDYIKKKIRSSFEYKEMISFLRRNIDMNRCSYFKKVNNSIKGITIEIHHEPFTLEDITYIVLSYFIDNGIAIDPAAIAEQVMLLHFQGLVGLIPVSKTVHELIGAKQIFVPINNVYGDIEEFYKRYHDYMTEDQKAILAKSIKMSDKLAKYPPTVLKKKFIYLDVDGMSLPSYVKSKKK